MTPPRDTGADTVFAAARMPATLPGFVLRFGFAHQVALSVLSVAVFLLEMVPLEIQRRIVNDAFKGGEYRTILVLALIYAGVAFGQGLIKLAMNIYRNWLGEKAVRSLRLTVETLARRAPADGSGARAVGIETSLMLAEAEPIGGFVGSFLSEPLVQGGILVSIFGYMVYLQPAMALVALLVFIPQIVFVPIMQAAINRRVASRIATLREVSGGMVAEVADTEGTPGRLQRRRIDTVFALDMGIFKLKFSMNFLMNLLNHIAVAGVLAVGGWFVVNGQTEVGTVVAFLSGLSRVNDPWGGLVDWFRDLAVTLTKYRLVASAVRDIDAELRTQAGRAFSPPGSVPAPSPSR
ncbi:ABC transporter transmembrane domain-containing protein [Ancylobacter terrae]|uniref:ABC transporter transmembrane domain-containing protein n=1 Tax=Ancylobacter sp. sgz301288 TaxID=3342077 RepID=UPI00385B2CB6